jgi:isoleucyl-tRNA synthetase
VRQNLEDYDARAAAERIATHIDELSTWYLRRSRRRFARAAGAADRASAFATLHRALVDLARVIAPVLPFLAEELYQELAVSIDLAAPESVHLTRWPDGELAGLRDEPLEGAMGTVVRAVDLARTLRGQAGLKVRQPLAGLWLTLPGGDIHERDALLALLAAEVNVKAVTVIADESELTERRIRPIPSRIGKRLGPTTQAVLAAARANEVEYLPDGFVRLAGATLAPDEVDVIAVPRPNTAVAHDGGLVVVIDTDLTDALRAEGDARELQRAVQDLRREAGLELDDTIELWVGVAIEMADRLAPFLGTVREETLANGLHLTPPPDDAVCGNVDLGGALVRIGLRRAGGRAGS